MQELPEINKTYNYFDDGKITDGRRLSVTITEIISFSEANSELIDYWKQDIYNEGDSHWLYSDETDYFIKGVIKEDDEEDIDVIFVRTIDGGWFSLGWWAGRLDVDGSLTKMLE